MTERIEFDADQRLDREFVSDESFSPTITIGREFTTDAVKHGLQLWWDGSTPTKRLDTRDGGSQFNRFVNARIEGKMAEVAFAKFLYVYFDIESQVDWRIYGDYDETDNGDLQHLVGEDGEAHTPAVEFDVKKTKPWNQWLAIRQSIYDRIDDDAPVVLTKLRIESELDVERFESVGNWEDVDDNALFRDRVVEFAVSEFPLDVEIVGAVYPDEFTDYFDTGDKLYDPDSGNTLGGPLRCDNRGVHVNDLLDSPERWVRVVNDIVGDNPVEWKPLTITGERSDGD